jgi:hypothetical protein
MKVVGLTCQRWMRRRSSRYPGGRDRQPDCDVDVCVHPSPFTSPVVFICDTDSTRAPTLLSLPLTAEHQTHEEALSGLSDLLVRFVQRAGSNTMQKRINALGRVQSMGLLPMIATTYNFRLLRRCLPAHHQAIHQSQLQ